MKFRYKVLFTNLILLSLGLGLVGYLMIHKNFELAKQTQLKNAIVQNNLVQSSVEYELLQLLNSASDNSVSQNADNSETSNNNTDNTGAKKSSVTASSITAQLPQIGGRVSSSVRSRDSFFYIYFDGEKVYTDDKSDAGISDTLFKNLTTGNKNYVIKEESQKHYIYVTSQSVIDEKNLCIVSKCDASEAYTLLDEQIKYFRLIIIVILIVESAAMYFNQQVHDKAAREA